MSCLGIYFNLISGFYVQDINIKLHKNTSQYHGQLQTEWKLQQTQDAANHLQSCCYYLENLDDGTVKSADEALHALNTIQSFLSKGRNALIIPKKRTIDDLVSSRNMVSLKCQTKSFLKK